MKTLNSISITKKIHLVRNEKKKHLLFAATECNFPSHVPDVAVSGKRNPVPREEHLAEEHLCCTGLSCFHDSSRPVLAE